MALCYSRPSLIVETTDSSSINKSCWCIEPAFLPSPAPLCSLFSLSNFTPWSWNNISSRASCQSASASASLCSFFHGLLSTHKSSLASHHSVLNYYCKTVAAFTAAQGQGTGMEVPVWLVSLNIYLLTDQSLLFELMLDVFNTKGNLILDYTSQASVVEKGMEQ